MGLQSYFVVYYNHETGEFVDDGGTCLAKFDDRPVYDPDADTWRHGWESVVSDAKAANELAALIELWNSVIVKKGGVATPKPASLVSHCSDCEDQEGSICGCFCHEE